MNIDANAKKVEKERPEIKAEIWSAVMIAKKGVSQWLVTIARSQGSGFTRCHRTLFVIIVSARILTSHIQIYILSDNLLGKSFCMKSFY